SSQNQRTDLILTLTPHIIRTANITEEDLLPMWVGTEANITFRGGSPRVESEVEGPFDEGEEEDAERIREMIRRRIQNLPRGLREGARRDTSEEEPPPGVELVPPVPPRDIFEEPEEDEEEEPPGTASNSSWLRGELEVLSLALEEPQEGQAASVPEFPVRIELRPMKKRVVVGETFEILVEAEAYTPVSHLPITLRYDPEMLRLKEVLQGEFLGPQARARVLADFSRPGRLVLGASRLGEVAGVVGSGTVARLRFEARTPGRTIVAFRSAQVLDADLKRVKPVGRVPARVRIIPVREAGERPRVPERSRPEG
ncbi:MAG: cohesin domain-containing protein, partial [Thermoanaerobaculia bacterium]